ncbi:MAG: glycerophosphodiester phosphodiesterase family protein [Clostridia bacterium]|nr:glycerophosphodiester phosphodiesterase family protein [Clostridia bacterium]
MEWLFKKPIAHRGLHNDKLPENSMPAFAAAIEKGYNIEMDLHLTSDGKIVVFHDSNLKRVCKIDKDIKLEDLTYEELIQYHLSGTDNSIPLFDELLELVDGKVGLLIELKNVNPFYHGLEKAVIERLKTYKGDFALQSFNPWSMKYCRLHSNFVVGQLATYENKSFAPLGKLYFAKISKPAFIAYDIRQAENKYVAKWRKSLPLLVWTINTPERLQKAKDIKANNIIFELLEPDFELK